MSVPTIFFDESNRLRSGWRFLIFQLLLVFFGGILGTGAEFVFSRLSLSETNSKLLSYVFPNVILLFLAILGGWLCGKYLEDLPFRALGAAFTRKWLKDLSFGLTLGAASILLAVLIALIFGGMRLEFNSEAAFSSILQTVLISLLIFTLGAAAEEAYFRGYILQTFARARLAWLAILLTSLFFAFAHSNNPGYTWLARFNTVIAGVWFALAYLKTRNLWFPFGLHFAWNFIQGAICGIPVSGLTNIATQPIFLETNKGAEQITGAGYGIEGGIACTIAIILSILLTHFAPFLKPDEEATSKN
jgi:membrane protease YdiL (CAAX protease family)